MYRPSKTPLVTGDGNRAAVRDHIDRRIADYQKQRHAARHPRDRWARQLGTILIDELLDLRNAILGVPKASTARHGAD